MEPLVDIVLEDDRWEAFGLDALATAAVRAAFAELGLAETGFSLCLMGCDDARILELNGDFRGKAKPTNVLSWPSEERGVAAGETPALPVAGEADDPEHLGDIAISFDTCAAEATEAGKPMVDHVTHLVVHGLLHLLGYDHIDDADADLMEATEVRILARLGLSDPY
ncbi:MAG: Endoribonuclease YbeY [Rhodobacteraceae bacterium]|uniref:rRNA maturation RNase YbeY n=1 Tax=Cypionkella sp. TaxID=2811411 RepID=UPI001326C6AE|nr:rRNA maturation RNase YbeY [Cypionkella sp.]KAF0173810.1 MAG: Endoribonuclease YbeY [Paracoccaceae bacterium]MDO8326788.1 rRNA maturation RNase YbeY [Cypionkella sp.]